MEQHLLLNILNIIHPIYAACMQHTFAVKHMGGHPAEKSFPLGQNFLVLLNK